MAAERIFTYAAPRLKFGPGASAEVGHDLRAMGASRVLVVTDPGVAAAGHAQRVADHVAAAGCEVAVHDDAHVEPTDASLEAAVAHARATGPWDGFVAVGGGSSIDTAKAVNLMTTNEGELLDYVNAPVGGGRAPSQPLRPLVALPTTTGTGSESTTVCVLDVLAQRVKSGISHESLRPTLAVVDPELSATQPPEVVASSGMDILCHALESLTARPYSDFPAHDPGSRPPYCGANPIADMWSTRALELLARSFVRAVTDPDDVAANQDMSMAATFAGLGFGNAGVHIPHANAYPIAGQVSDFHPPGYPDDHAMVPHGMAVALTAPAAFGFTFDSDPARHLQAADLLVPDRDRDQEDAEALPRAIVGLMEAVGMPNGIGGVGFAAGDVDDLVTGTMKQQRLLSIAPRTPSPADIADIFERSLALW